jgi:hypothetical protein
LQRFFNGSLNPFVRDMRPASVMQLSLKSEGIGPPDIALDALFRHFHAVPRTQLPNLQKRHIACKQVADNAHKQQGTKIVTNCGREGVLVYLQAYDYSGGLDQDK